MISGEHRGPRFQLHRSGGPQPRERLAAGPLPEDQVATLSDAIFIGCLSASKSAPFPEQPVEYHK